jgi:hypothetical protein
MRDSREPACDGLLQNLKELASAGRGPRGRLYDAGVLWVVGQVERTGGFSPDPIKLAYGVHACLQRGHGVIAPGELAEAQRMCQARGWSLDEGAQYAAGVRDAEALLADYAGAAGG